LATGLPGVFAAGDVARWPNGRFGEEMRVEHWTNANEQGALAAKNLLVTGGADGSGTGVAEAYEPVPFFWSDQYGSRLQYLGRASADDEVQVVHGSIDERAWVALYGRDGQLRGALGVNQPKLLAGYRKLFAARASWADALAHAASVNG
jgi:3-phenylpropionate/trans-cinnamate dioxygenase ferredoxin reductase subunit